MKHSSWCVIGVCLAGCAVGPDYVRPEPSAPDGWSEAQGGRVSTESAELAAWWTAFGDPVLESLIERAAASNLDCKVAAARVREARAQAGRTRSELGPEVEAGAGITRQRSSENGAVAVEDPESDFYSAGFDSVWEIDLFGRTRRAVEASEAEVEATVEERRAVLVSLAAEVATAYVELRGNRRLAEVARRNAAAARETLELTRSRAEGGLATELDVARAEVLLAGAEAPLPHFEARARVALHRLSVLLALSPDELSAELAQARPVPTPPERILVGLPSEALARRPDVRRAERALAAATARIGAARAERYPRFSLTSAFGLESVHAGDFADAASRAWSIGPALRWPLFSSGRILAEVEVQDARAEQALHAYRGTLLTALEEVENALVGYLREWDHQRSLVAATSAGRRSVALAEDLYRSALTSFLDVLDAERGLYESELELARSEVEITLRVVSLYKALGGGWEALEGERVAGAP